MQTIRYYEKEGLLPEPLRSSGNYRLYGESHIERLQFIRHCRTLAMPLEEIRALLRYRDIPTQDCAEINNLIDQHVRQVEERILELQALKLQLDTLRQKCAGARSIETCGILRDLAGCLDHSK